MLAGFLGEDEGAGADGGTVEAAEEEEEGLVPPKRLVGHMVFKPEEVDEVADAEDATAAVAADAEAAAVAACRSASAASSKQHLKMARAPMPQPMSVTGRRP
jgi:hypothetical protein